MPHNRYFHDAPLHQGEIISLTGDEYHHLVHVLRAKPEESVDLVNGRGELALAKVGKISKQAVELTIENVTCESPKKPLILALALPRMNHLEWVIEKGTELNATAFWLFPGILSEKENLSDSQFKRLKHLAISAMKQCGRLDLPSIELRPPLLQWKPLEGMLLFGDLAEKAPDVWEIDRETHCPLVWFIGPEKGFDTRERAFLLNTLKAKGVRLHPNILRAETAPLVALSLSQFILQS